MIKTREERIEAVDITIEELKSIYNLGEKPPKEIQNEYENTINVLKDLKDIIKNGKYI